MSSWVSPRGVGALPQSLRPWMSAPSTLAGRLGTDFRRPIGTDPSLSSMLATLRGSRLTRAPDNFLLYIGDGRRQRANLFKQLVARTGHLVHIDDKSPHSPHATESTPLPPHLTLIPSRRSPSLSLSMSSLDNSKGCGRLWRDTVVIDCTYERRLSTGANLPPMDRYGPCKSLKLGDYHLICSNTCSNP